MSKLTRTSRIFVILLIGLAFGSGIVSAEYLGPDRTYNVTTWETCDKGVWAHTAGYHECVSADGSWAEACIDCTWVCDRGSACGSATYWYTTGTVAVEHTVTHTDPEATVASTTNCAAWGDASWCVQLSSVTITANEPVAGDQITLIEGTQNGGAFACPADTCTVNMLEGSNALTYWALSTYGDSSRMGNLTVLQDTIAPEINASVSGTLGTNNWFVSDATLSVVFSDASPGSGLLSTSAVINGTLTDVSAPVTLPEGVYTIQLDTRDVAGWTASTAQTVSVDTTAPVVTANQPAVEVSNSEVTGGGYMNGSVVFTGTYSDATSGVAQVQVSPDGSNWFAATLNADGTWIYDWDSSQAKDGSYTPLVYAVDNAGNRTDITLQPISLDNSAPAMSMTGSWYIWDSGHIVVFDNRVGIARIELSVRDDQNRWPAREWDYDTSKLEMDLQWDRKFGDGTTAPTGSYEVLLQAWDKLGNGRWITSRIYIPEAGATAVIPLDGFVNGGTFEDTPTPMAEQTKTEESGADTVITAAPAETNPEPTATLQPSSTPSSFNFSSAPIIPASGSSKSTSLPVDPNLLTGAAALAAAASATAYSLQRKEEKEAERKRQEAESKAEAMAKVREAQLVKEANAFAHNMMKNSGDSGNNLFDKDAYEKLKKYYLANTAEPMSEEEQLALEKYLLSLSAEAYAANVGSQEIVQSENDIRRNSAETARYQGLADEYYQQQAADERAEQAVKTQSYYAASIAAYQERKAREASEYSNQTKAFNEANKKENEKVVQNTYQSFINKESTAQGEIDAYKEQQWKETVSNYTVPDYMKTAYLGTAATGEGVFTPDEDLQEVIDANIAKQVEEGISNNWIAGVLNSASAGLGVLHDTIDPPIKKIFGSDAAQSAYDFLTGFGQEIMLCELWPAFIASPSAAEHIESIIPETRAAYLGRIFGNIAVDIISALEISSAIFGGGAAVLATEIGTVGIGTPAAVLEIEGVIVIVTHGAGSIVASATSMGENIRAFSQANSGGNSSAQSGNNPTVKTGTIDDLPQNASEMYKKYDQHGWQGNVSGQTPGTAAGKKYHNRNNFLPSVDSSGNPITYQEFDVNNRSPNATRDSERFVRGSDGSVYYTDSHFEDTFLQIIGGD